MRWKLYTHHYANSETLYTAAFWNCKNKWYSKKCLNWRYYDGIVIIRDRDNVHLLNRTGDITVDWNEIFWNYVVANWVWAALFCFYQEYKEINNYFQRNILLVACFNSWIIVTWTSWISKSNYNSHQWKAVLCTKYQKHLSNSKCSWRNMRGNLLEIIQSIIRKNFFHVISLEGQCVILVLKIKRAYDLLIYLTRLCFKGAQGSSPFIEYYYLFTKKIFTWKFDNYFFNY